MRMSIESLQFSHRMLTSEPLSPLLITFTDVFAYFALQEGQTFMRANAECTT